MIEKNALLDDQNTLPADKMENLDATEKIDTFYKKIGQSQTESTRLTNNRYSRTDDSKDERKNSTTAPNKMKRDSVRSSFKSYHSLKSVDDDYVSCKSSLNNSVENLTDASENVIDNGRGRHVEDIVHIEKNVTDNIYKNDCNDHIEDNRGINKVVLCRNETDQNGDIIQSSNLENGNYNQNLYQPNSTIKPKDTYENVYQTNEAHVNSGSQRNGEEDFGEHNGNDAFTSQTFIEIEKLARAVENISLNKITFNDNVPTVTVADIVKPVSPSKEIQNEISENEQRRSHQPNQMEHESLNEIRVYVDGIVKESEAKVVIGNGTFNHIVKMDSILEDQQKDESRMLGQNIANIEEEFVDRLDADNDLSVLNRYKVFNYETEIIGSDEDEIVIDIDEDVKTGGDHSGTEFQDVPLGENPLSDNRYQIPDSSPLPSSESLPSGNMVNFADVVQRSRAAFESGKSKPYEFRLRQLKALLRLYEENQQDLMNALAADLRKHKQEAILLEIEFLANDVRNSINHLKEWMKPAKPGKDIANILDGVYIYPDPYGVCLVIGAWNYPLQLSLLPAAGAVAAGNTVILKPSEVAPASAKIMAELIPKYLDHDTFQVVLGGVEETTELLRHRFDYIFYTGSSAVGKLVRQAANEHLTPVTLELGGKSPLYIDSSVNVELAARRILWGKCINAGQTCIAPDYVLCSREMQTKLLAEAKRVLDSWYTEKSQESKHFCRIVSDKHFQRLKTLAHSSGTIALGGDMDAADRFIAPTILVDVKPSDPIMGEEIFGPILPIINVDSAYEAIQLINSRPKPLTLYLFSSNAQVQDLFIHQTHSGSMCINDTIMQYGVDTLPFGGVGLSGMGAYHGKYTFDTFTHRKSCLVKDFNPVLEALSASRYPPYSDSKIKFIQTMMRKRPSIPGLSYLPYLALFGLGMLSSLLVQYLSTNKEPAVQ